MQGLSLARGDAEKGAERQLVVTTAPAGSIGHTTMPCLMRRPCFLAFIRRAAIGGPHGGTRTGHGSVVPVVPLAPDPDAHAIGPHGIGGQSGDAAERASGHGGGGHEVVEPDAPVLPFDCVLITGHGQSTVTPAEPFQMRSIPGGQGGGHMEEDGPVVPVVSVEPVAGHGGGHAHVATLGDVVAPLEPLEPLEPALVQGGGHTQSAIFGDRVEPVEPVEPVVRQGGGQAHIAVFGTAGVMPVEPLEPVEPVPVRGHGGGHSHAGPGDVVPAADEPAITHGGPQRHGTTVAPLEPRDPVAPVGGHFGGHHGTRSRVVGAPLVPVAPEGGQGIGTKQAGVDPVEPVVPVAPLVSGLTQRTQIAAEPRAAAGHGTQPIDPVAPVEPDEPPAGFAILQLPQTRTHRPRPWARWRSFLWLPLRRPCCVARTGSKRPRDFRECVRWPAAVTAGQWITAPAAVPVPLAT
jgi:hypothetical protein